VDLAEDLLGVVEVVDVVFWPAALDFKKSDVEALPEGELAAALIKGAARTSEQKEMAQLLRHKAAAVVAFGSCAVSGGIPGLVNLCERAEILSAVYHQAPTVADSDGTAPCEVCAVPEGELRRLSVDASVRTLDQVVDPVGVFYRYGLLACCTIGWGRRHERRRDSHRAGNEARGPWEDPDLPWSWRRCGPGLPAGPRTAGVRLTKQPDNKAARAFVHRGCVDDGLLNQVEMAFRACDPRLACATHNLPGNMPLVAV
jgi:Ni,Fe-hydrogenase III small subunit